MYKRCVAVFFILTTTLLLASCNTANNENLPKSDVITSASKSEGSASSNQEDILKKAWSYVDEYKGSGVVSSVKEIDRDAKSSITIKYNNALEEDILAYVQQLGFTSAWIPPTSSGGTYFISETLKEKVTLSIWYLKEATKDNFEMVVDISK